ncbi:hypothetical protein BJF79_32410 [Actinomadura sp. CNU-125]|uniref:hypothetical protein n=1 Tax=Actinomadura sp. CNU-125 TaxID=1904961 RepID=UPI0009698FB2|nr:hypothetical protein [Actinomadura sp. CNU-125]OLT35463.1 hypothetical protein BJF79_32410 [Actinomadura sp. CNU-125]
MPTESPTRFVMVPARRSSEPTARRRARRILGALFLAASLSIVAVLVSLVGGQDGADPSGTEPRGRELAATAAVNHLAGVAQNVPHAASFDPEDAAGAPRAALSGRQGVPLSYRSLSWVGFSPQNFGSEEAGFTEFEVHHFLVALTDPPPTDAPQPAPGTPAPGAGTAPASPGGRRPHPRPGRRRPPPRHRRRPAATSGHRPRTCSSWTSRS